MGHPGAKMACLPSILSLRARDLPGGSCPNPSPLRGRGKGSGSDQGEGAPDASFESILLESSNKSWAGSNDPEVPHRARRSIFSVGFIASWRAVPSPAPFGSLSSPPEGRGFYELLFSTLSTRRTDELGMTKRGCLR